MAVNTSHFDPESEMHPRAELWGQWNQPHVRVGRVHVFAGRSEEAVRLCVQRLTSRLGGVVATANLDFLAIARSEPQAAAVLERASLVIADGAPVAWMARLIGIRTIERLSGVDLVEGIFRETNEPLRVFLYGSTPEIATRAASAMQRKHEHVEVVGIINPPFRDLSKSEQDEHAAAISLAGPDVVLVALGFPRQEQFMLEFQQAAPQGVWIGIGGTLDFYAGIRRRAPRVVQRVGLEWAVRMAQEPKRLWRRYLLRDIPELVRCAAECSAARFRRHQ